MSNIKTPASSQDLQAAPQRVGTPETSTVQAAAPAPAPAPVPLPKNLGASAIYDINGDGKFDGGFMANVYGNPQDFLYLNANDVGMPQGDYTNFTGYPDKVTPKYDANGKFSGWAMHVSNGIFFHDNTGMFRVAVADFIVTTQNQMTYTIKDKETSAILKAGASLLVGYVKYGY